MRTECKRVLCSKICREVGGEGIFWGIREEPEGNSFLGGAQWGLELDFSPAKSPPELPPTCWECWKPEKQGGPPEAVTLWPAHLGKRRKKSGKGGGREGGRLRELKEKGIGKETQTHIFRRI